MTGPVAEAGNQILIALQLWRDDVNAKGGLLGRPIEIVYRDDQSNPGKELRIYRELFTNDNVHLVIGPYGTIASAAVMRAILDFHRVTVSILGAGANWMFSNSKYFSMAPTGPDGPMGLAKDFFDFADQLQPKPQTVAILGAEIDPAKPIADAARTNATAHGFNIVYYKSYPLETGDFGPILRELEAANADVVFVSASSQDTAGIVEAAKAVGLAPKLFGGSLPGLQSTALKAQLGPALNGLVVGDNFVPASTLNFSGLHDLLKRYRKMAASVQTDPLGYEVVPFAYAAGQVLAQAVEETKDIDDLKLAEYIHNNRFATVVGDVEFGKKGEWKDSRMLLVQFQHVSANSVEQFAETKVQPIVWPPQYKTGGIIYPYADAKK
jgi:branched-chain amino acid transport system substrate-binding protein